MSDDWFNRPIVLVAALALVSLLPFLFMGLTAFVKISTVLQIAKSAIGAQSVPSNTVIMALSAALTLVVMAPVGERMLDRTAPLLVAKAPTSELIVRGVDAVREPMRDFLKRQSSDRETDRFLELAKSRASTTSSVTAPAPSREDFAVLVPSFITSELTRAFGIGFLIYLPFLVIDLVVANLLLALGMQMLSPTQVSLPFKLLLFVAMNGWGLLAQALIQGYA
jgi:type III secretion protein R